jgi:hypothetical protein
MRIGRFPQCPTVQISNTTNKKETPPLQTSNETHTDLWTSAMGEPLIPTWKYSTATIGGSPIHSERTVVDKQPENP